MWQDTLWSDTTSHSGLWWPGLRGTLWVASLMWWPLRDSSGLRQRMGSVQPARFWGSPAPGRTVTKPGAGLSRDSVDKD